MYNLTQLNKYGVKFLKDTYGLELEIPIKFNARMKTTCGWFRSRRNRVTGESIAICIEMNKFFVENNDPITVLDVLRHELVHYALFKLGKPNKDGHPVFESELRRLKIVSQSTIDRYQIKSKPVTVSRYQCTNCNHTYNRKRALPNNGVNHRCNCGGKLASLGKTKVSG